MKKLFLLAIIAFFSTSINAQLLKRLGDRAKSKVEQKAGEKVDKGIDNAVDGKKKAVGGHMQQLRALSIKSLERIFCGALPTYNRNSLDRFFNCFLNGTHFFSGI